MAKGDKRPQRVKDDPRIDHAVVVQLAQVLDRRYTLLVVLERVDLIVVSSSSLKVRRDGPRARRGRSQARRRSRRR